MAKTVLCIASYADALSKMESIIYTSIVCNNDITLKTKIAKNRVLVS